MELKKKMETLIITKKDLDEDNFYKADEIDFDGHIEIEKDLSRSW